MLTQSSLFQQFYTCSIGLTEFLGSFETSKLLLSYDSTNFPEYKVVALDMNNVPRVTESVTPGMKLASSSWVNSHLCSDRSDRSDILEQQTSKGVVVAGIEPATNGLLDQRSTD